MKKIVIMFMLAITIIMAIPSIKASAITVAQYTHDFSALSGINGGITSSTNKYWVIVERASTGDVSVYAQPTPFTILNNNQLVITNGITAQWNVSGTQGWLNASYIGNANKFSIDAAYIIYESSHLISNGSVNYNYPIYVPVPTSELSNGITIMSPSQYENIKTTTMNVYFTVKVPTTSNVGSIPLITQLPFTLQYMNNVYNFVDISVYIQTNEMGSKKVYFNHNNNIIQPDTITCDSRTDNYYIFHGMITVPTPAISNQYTITAKCKNSAAIIDTYTTFTKICDINVNKNDFVTDTSGNIITDNDGNLVSTTTPQSINPIVPIDTSPKTYTNDNNGVISSVLDTGGNILKFISNVVSLPFQMVSSLITALNSGISMLQNTIGYYNPSNPDTSIGIVGFYGNLTSFLPKDDANATGTFIMAIIFFAIMRVWRR
jgi:hypothetical protein